MKNPIVNFNDPKAIVQGTPLSSVQLNATANVAGTFAYLPPLGTVLDAKASHTLTAIFTPTDKVTYSEATSKAHIAVTAKASADTSGSTGPFAPGQFTAKINELAIGTVTSRPVPSFTEQVYILQDEKTGKWSPKVRTVALDRNIVWDSASKRYIKSGSDGAGSGDMILSSQEGATQVAKLYLPA